MKKKQKGQYHHGELAESLLDAVEILADKFGLEAVTLRGCAKQVGVSPSSAFRHYADKRALMTAFATRALQQLAGTMAEAHQQAQAHSEDAFIAVSMAYLTFALEKTAWFRAMWREEMIYATDPDYQQAENELIHQIQGGFASTLDDMDPHDLSEQELLAWSSIHGLASLYVDGSLSRDLPMEAKLDQARAMLAVLLPAISKAESAAADRG